MDYLMLIDKFNPVPAKVTENLELISIRGYLMESQAGKQLEKMLTAAENDDIKINIISAFRSNDYQQMLWEREISLEMWGGLCYAAAVDKVAKTLALPGSSEHNTGLAVDLGTECADDVEEDFHQSKQARWLSHRSADFGFILRYPRLKEHITGISYEPWHYRYVGAEAAQMITQSGICLEEFLHFYSEKYI